MSASEQNIALQGRNIGRVERIIAGRFQTKDDADAVAALIAQYIDTSDICIFHNNPPGRHDAFAVGGDEDEDPGAEGADKSATGAYMGSLAGAMYRLGNHDYRPRASERRPGGVLLSVRIADPVNEKRVIATLRAQGAADIEQAQGEWRDGDWADFNPVAAPRLVESASR